MMYFLSARKAIFIVAFLLFTNLSFAQEGYQPSPENLKARQWFRDAKFGLFIHWGVYSVLGDGEWVMNNQQIPIEIMKNCQLSSIQSVLTLQHGSVW